MRESVDSLYRDDADAQYIQYVSKSHETQPRMHFKLKEASAQHTSLSDFTISKTDKLSQKHCGTESNTKVCSSHFLLIMILSNNDNSQIYGLSTHHH